MVYNNRKRKTIFPTEVRMAISIKQVSSLEKIKRAESLDRYGEIKSKTAIRGERISYQLVLNSDVYIIPSKITIESDLGDAVKLYRVSEVFVDTPSTEDVSGENYLITEPDFLPDCLVPLGKNDEHVTVSRYNTVFWVRADIPGDATPGIHKIRFSCKAEKVENGSTVWEEVAADELELTVLDAEMPEQTLIYTRWFYADCIADVHNVKIYSEEHWSLIEKYIAAAVDVGINMILVPTHTPPLDTDIGITRPCVQLIDIEKRGDEYFFGFEKFSRFIGICKKCGVKYYEMAHLFSQWGAAFSPNILVKENGVLSYAFGWHIKATDESYRAFLKQYIRAISEQLKAEGISDKTYFHVSDEPNSDSIENYRAARDIIKPLIGESKTFDALSDVEFCENGLVECPVTCIDNLHKFLPYDIENQWAYYCCGPQKVFVNSFIALPSGRVRALGYQLYKYNIKGFLHWGYNFYNCARSRYHINPYLTTSADGAFPSGDGFIVYPSTDGVNPSIRGEVTYMAIQDMSLCLGLEAKIGRDAVIKMINDAAGYELTLEKYPSDTEFYEKLREKMATALNS